MKLCSNGHDEICYDARECPCCELQVQLKDLREETDDRLFKMGEYCTERIAKAEDHFDGLAKATIAAYKEEFGPDWVNKIK